MNHSTALDIKLERILRYFPILISEIYKIHVDNHGLNSAELKLRIYVFGLASIQTPTSLVLWNYQQEHPYTKQGNFLLEIPIENSLKNKRKICTFELFLSEPNTVSALIAYCDGHICFWRDINCINHFLTCLINFGGTILPLSINFVKSDIIYIFGEFTYYQLEIFTNNISFKNLSSSNSKQDSLVSLLSPWSYWTKKAFDIKYIVSSYIGEIKSNRCFIILTSEDISFASLAPDSTKFRIENKIKSCDLLKEIHWPGFERYDIKTINLCNYLYLNCDSENNFCLFLLIDVHLTNINDESLDRNIILVKCNGFDLQSLVSLANFPVRPDLIIKPILLTNTSNTLIVAFSDTVYFVYDGIFESFNFKNSSVIASMIFKNGSNTDNIMVDRFIVCTWPHGLFELKVNNSNYLDKSTQENCFDSCSNKFFNIILDEKPSDKLLRMFYCYIDNEIDLNNENFVSEFSCENFYPAVKSNLLHLTLITKNEFESFNDQSKLLEKKCMIFEKYLSFFLELNGIYMESVSESGIDYSLLDFIIETYEMLLMLTNIEQMNRSLLTDFLSDMKLENAVCFSKGSLNYHVIECVDILKQISEYQSIILASFSKDNIGQFMKLWSSIKFLSNLLKILHSNPCRIMELIDDQNLKIIATWRNSSSFFYKIVMEQINILEIYIVDSSKWLPIEHQLIKIEIAHVLHSFAHYVLLVSYFSNIDYSRNNYCLFLMEKLVNFGFHEIALNLSEEFSIFPIMFKFNSDNLSKMNEYRNKFKDTQDFVSKYYQWCHKNGFFKKIIEFYRLEDGNIEKYLFDNKQFYWIYLYKSNMIQKCVDVLIELSSETTKYHLKKFYISIAKLIYCRNISDIEISTQSSKKIEKILVVCFYQDQAISSKDNNVYSIKEISMLFVDLYLTDLDSNHIKKAFDLSTYMEEEESHQLVHQIWRKIIKHENWTNVELDQSFSLKEKLQSTVVYKMNQFLLSIIKDNVNSYFIIKDVTPFADDQQFIEEICAKNLLTQEQFKKILIILFKMIKNEEVI